MQPQPSEHESSAISRSLHPKCHLTTPSLHERNTYGNRHGTTQQLLPRPSKWSRSSLMRHRASSCSNTCKTSLDALPRSLHSPTSDTVISSLYRTPCTNRSTGQDQSVCPGAYYRNTNFLTPKPNKLAMQKRQTIHPWASPRTLGKR